MAAMYQNIALYYVLLHSSKNSIDWAVLFGEYLTD